MKLDFGIIITPGFKFSDQASHASSKANSILDILKYTFMSRVQNCTEPKSVLITSLPSPHGIHSSGVISIFSKEPANNEENSTHIAWSRD